MTLTYSLYSGRFVRLAPIDHEKDPPVIAGWTPDPLWHSGLSDMARPMPAAAIRKMLEKIEKQMEETKNLFHFTLRTKNDDRLVGLAKLFRIDFHNGTSLLDLGIGDTTDRRHGYGFDALNLLLGFAFDELNLHRISVITGADNIPFIGMVKKAGFKEEVRQREADFHNGRYWDIVHLGLLHSEREVEK